MEYLSGFGNQHATEALEGALPQGLNSPQKCAYNLYAEQINGTAFTAPRSENKRTWLYRLRPSVSHQSRVTPYLGNKNFSDNLKGHTTPEPMRWNPLPEITTNVDFIDGLITMMSGGGEGGLAIHLYKANKDMIERFFYNADAEMLIVPQKGGLYFKTEMGNLEVSPKEIIVIPRGIKFSVTLKEGSASGYMCENFGELLRIPDLGPIGANGLANPRDFLSPIAAFEDVDGKFEVISKFGGELQTCKIEQSPCDVVAWHGNYAPYKYDLNNFVPMNNVMKDHADPSIFTVLTSPTAVAGTANLDFVIFPPRWIVAEETFRPPYYHRNIMSEFMGLIEGVYDAKEGGGFVGGGSSLHSCMTGHGPDETVFNKASTTDLKPSFMGKTLAFMFETRHLLRLTDYAINAEGFRQKDYSECWAGLKKADLKK